MRRGSLAESLTVFFQGPREIPALLGVPALIKVEALMWVFYLFRFLPLDIYLQGRPLSDHPFGDFRFGETPYFTALEICRLARLQKGEHFYDLGCGRGKMVFTAALGFGAQAVGVDLLPIYSRFGNRIAERTGADVRFLLEDFTLVEVFEADVVYVAGSIFSDETWDSLMEMVEQLQPGSRWVCVGRQAEHPLLKAYDRREMLFSWGYEPVYFYQVDSDVVALEHLHASVGVEFEQTRAPAHLIANQAEDPQDQIEVVLEDQPTDPAVGLGRAENFPVVAGATQADAPPEQEDGGAAQGPALQEHDQTGPESALSDDEREMPGRP